MNKSIENLVKLRGYEVGKKDNESECVDVPLIKESLQEISEKQVKIFESAKKTLENFRIESKIINQNDAGFKEISKLKLTNYKFVFKGEYIHIKDFVNNYHYATVSLGNEKLKKDNPNKVFIIWNVMQILTCPNATESCKKFCYANKFPYVVSMKNSTAIKSRLNNTVFSMIENFDDIMLDLITFVENTLKYEGKEVLFRWHEAGDIYNPIYWNKIKRVIEGNVKVNHIIYTKTVFMIDNMIKHNYNSNGIIRYSLDDSTNSTIYNKVIKSNVLTSRVVDKKDVSLIPESHTCNSSCDKCNKCLNKKLLDIFMPIH